MTARKRVPVSEAAKRILYVEGNNDCREMLAVMLIYEGYRVSTAVTMAEGLSMARLEPFDLFILGGSYIDGTGTDMCYQLHVLYPNTPILIYSSAAGKSDIKAGMAAGAQIYLTKPEGASIVPQTVAGLFVGVS